MMIMLGGYSYSTDAYRIAYHGVWSTQMMVPPSLSSSSSRHTTSTSNKKSSDKDGDNPNRWNRLPSLPSGHFIEHVIGSIHL
jgi:hypothetical protein